MKCEEMIWKERFKRIRRWREWEDREGRNKVEGENNGRRGNVGGRRM